MKVIKLLVNGAERRVEVEADTNLLNVLRDDLELTGAKYGCGEGQCGACTILVEGQPVRSCITMVGAVEGKPITTIEAMEQDGRFHPHQEAFLEAGAMQCGYCIPGMIMSGVALLNSNPHPDDAEIIRHMDGHICRCGTYARIVKAVRKAAQAAK